MVLYIPSGAEFLPSKVCRLQWKDCFYLVPPSLKNSSRWFFTDWDENCHLSPPFWDKIFWFTFSKHLKQIQGYKWTGVITPVTHLFSAICRGPVSPHLFSNKQIEAKHHLRKKTCGEKTTFTSEKSDRTFQHFGGVLAILMIVELACDREMVITRYY